MSKAVQRSGVIWLSMAKDVLVERGRKMKSVGSQGEMSTVELGKPMMGEGGEVKYENDLSEARFDVAVDVGPSSSSKRAAVVRELTGMMQLTTDAETAQVLGAMAMMNMEGEGISEVRDYFRRKLIKLGVVKPTEEEGQKLLEELQNQKPDANTTYLEAAAQNEEAKADKAKADTINTLAKTEETQAKTAEILANMDRSEREEVLNMVDKMQEAQIPREGEV